MERTPKSECTRKIEQDRSISKILTFGQHLHKSQLFLEIGRLYNFWASNEETGPKIGMYSKNWVGQVRFENFDFLVNICTKVNFFENWTFAQFLNFEWRNGSQNRNVLEKLSGTSSFWKLWFSGQGQKSAWSKHFLFIFLFLLFFFFFFRRFGPGQISGSVRVEPGQTGQQRMTSSMTSQCWNVWHVWRMTSSMTS